MNTINQAWTHDPYPPIAIIQELYTLVHIVYISHEFGFA